MPEVVDYNNISQNEDSLSDRMGDNNLQHSALKLDDNQVGEFQLLEKLNHKLTEEQQKFNEMVKDTKSPDDSTDNKSGFAIYKSPNIKNVHPEPSVCN